MKEFLSTVRRMRPFACSLGFLVLFCGCAGLAGNKGVPRSEPAVPGSAGSATAAISGGLPGNVPEERLSQPGKYQGYSLPLYDEISMSSQYITMRDGTKLAALILRPAEDRKPVGTPLPVIWTHERYHREGILGWPWLKTLLKYGYVIVSVDARGTGASFGTYRGIFSPEETRDAYDVTEWLAIQPWSTGNIGMFGRSYMGGTQYAAAGTAPPHLRAIFPEMAEFDRYSFFYPGGVFHDDFLRELEKMIHALDKDGMPVDEDTDKAMLKAALAEHAANMDVYELYSSSSCRDSVSDMTGTQPYHAGNPMSSLDVIRDTGVPVYIWEGWNDMFPRDALLWYENLTNPRKIVMGPWAHPELGSLDLAVEQLRWFDYWLKGIDNGVMDEAPVIYYTMGEGMRAGRHSAEAWPLPEQKLTAYYFGGERSGSVESANDGSLSPETPDVTGGVDEYVVDYSTTTGKVTRWTAGYNVISPAYGTMMWNDRKGLTYTSAPLTAEVEVTGHPVVHLWVTSTAKDGDFFVYLEDVGESRFSKYITEGSLRASHRALSRAPYENSGLPYHRSNAEDIADLPEYPVELVFDLLPTSYVFAEGHRIRVTVTCADKDNALTPRLDPPPTVRLYREADHASYIVLPVIPNP